jgi:hypothetical protein
MVNMIPGSGVGGGIFGGSGRRDIANKLMTSVDLRKY